MPSSNDPRPQRSDLFNNFISAQKNMTYQNHLEAF